MCVMRFCYFPPMTTVLLYGTVDMVCGVGQGVGQA